MLPPPTEAANRPAARGTSVLLGAFNVLGGDHVTSQTQHLLTAQIKLYQCTHSLIH